MNLLDIFEGREPHQQAIDRLEQARIDHLKQDMDYYAKHKMVKEFQKAKAEYKKIHKIKDECMGYGNMVGEETHEFKGAHGKLDVERTPGRTVVTRKEYPDTRDMQTDKFPNSRLKGKGTGSAIKTGSGIGSGQGSMRKFPRLDHDANDAPRYGVDEGGIPGNVPVEKIPGKEDLLKGRGRNYYEADQKKNADNENNDDWYDEDVEEGYAATIGPDTAPLPPEKQWRIQVRQLIADYIKNPQGLYNIAKRKGANSAEAMAYKFIMHPKGKIDLPPDAVTFEGYQDFNKLEPYAVAMKEGTKSEEWTVSINGKPWNKTFSSKAQADKAAKTIEKNYGKKTKVTGATIEASQAYNDGRADKWYHRQPRNNFEKGTKDYQDYIDGYGGKSFSTPGVTEAVPTIQGTPKTQPSADYTGEDLVRDANALFTAGGFKLVDKEVEPRVDNPKKINTTYYWRKKIKGLTPDQGQVQGLMIEIYNYAPKRTYWAINDWANDGAQVTPDLAQKLWRRMEKTIKDSIDTAEQENYWYGMIGNGKVPKDLEEAANPAQQAAIAIAMKKAGKKPKQMDEGATSNLHADLADVYRRMAPGIERHRDSFKAGQLYDALEAVAEQHNAHREFTRMMGGARNRAHMDYDTNPGGFQNWFWYLPFAEEELEEGLDLINMSDLQFYKELLGVMIIPVAAFGAMAWHKAMNAIKLYRAEDVITALQKKGVTVDRSTLEQIKPLLLKLERAIDVDKDGDVAKELAKRIQQTVTWGKLKQVNPDTTVNRKSEIVEEQDTSGVESAILRRIMTAHTDLLMKFGPEKVMQAAEEVAYNVGDVDEIGPGDVSAYVNQVQQILGVE